MRSSFRSFPKNAQIAIRDSCGDFAKAVPAHSGPIIWRGFDFSPTLACRQKMPKNQDLKRKKNLLIYFLGDFSADAQNSTIGAKTASVLSGKGPGFRVFRFRNGPEPISGNLRSYRNLRFGHFSETPGRSLSCTQNDEHPPRSTICEKCSLFHAYCV